MWRFFKDFCLYGLVGLLGKIAAVFLLPVYTNILTREEYGAMTLIFACSGVIDLVSNLNIHSGIARDYYEEGIDRKNLVSTGFFSILLLSLFILVNLMATRHFWMNSVLSIDSRHSMAFVVMLLSIPTSSLQSYFAILTRFKKKALLFSIGAAIGLVVKISVAILCVVVWRTGIVGIFWGELLSGLFCAIFYSLANRELLSFSFDWHYLKRALLFSLPTLPAILAGWLDTSVGQIIIGRNISLTDLGIYSIAISVTSVFTFICTAFQNVWYPFLYENYKMDNFGVQIRTIFISLSVALSLIAILLSLFSKEIILLLSNKTYLDATKYITLLSIPMIIYVLFPIGASGISIARDTKQIGIAYVLGSVMNLTVLLLVIEKLGVIAVPVCLLLSRLISYFYLYYQSGKYVKFNLPNRMILALIVVMAGLYFIDGLNLELFARLVIFIALVAPMLLWVWRKYDISVIVSKFIHKNRAGGN